MTASVSLNRTVCKYFAYGRHYGIWHSNGIWLHNNHKAHSHWFITRQHIAGMWQHTEIKNISDKGIEGKH